MFVFVMSQPWLHVAPVSVATERFTEASKASAGAPPCGDPRSFRGKGGGVRGRGLSRRGRGLGRGGRGRGVVFDEGDGGELFAELLQHDHAFQQRHVIDIDSLGLQS